MVPEKQWEGAGPERTQQGKVVHYEVWHFGTASLDVWIVGIGGKEGLVVGTSGTPLSLSVSSHSLE